MKIKGSNNSIDKKDSNNNSRNKTNHCDARQLLAIKLLVETSLKDYEVAEQVGVSKTTLVNWKKLEYFKQELRKTINNNLEYEAADCFRNILSLCKNATSEAVKLNANIDILNRAGYKPTDKQQLEFNKIDIQIDYGD